MYSKLKNSKSRIAERTGATIVLMLFLLVVVFIFVAFAIDTGRIQLAQLKLQTSADFAARAGAEAMARGVGDVSNIANFEQAVRDEINMVISGNTLFGSPVTLDANAQIQFGLSAVIDGSQEDSIGIGNGNGNGNGNGLIKRRNKKHQFATPTNGALSKDSNAVQVFPDINQFPVIFGRFLGRDNVNLHGTATAQLQERDIVLVLDRTTSMCTPDGGLFPIADFPPNLQVTEDLLYGPGDAMHDGSQHPRTTEFTVSGTDYVLTRMQAAKLAVYFFKKEVLDSFGNEQLGIATYSRFADRPADAIAANQVSDGTAIDIDSPNFYNGDNASASEAFKRIVGISPFVGGDGINPDGITDTSDSDAPAAHERYSSALETENSGYSNFDHTYLSMRYSGNTHISNGIEAGVDILFGEERRSIATPVMIVLTDGRENSGSDARLTATEVMAQHPNLRIFTISFGDANSAVDVGLMADVAATGKGEHHHAEDVAELVEVFRTLARSAGVHMVD